jgi:hypothetical protein
VGEYARLGKFVLLRPLRKDGPGALTLALDAAAGRIVVLKRLAAKKESPPAARFADEIQVSFRVAHPNLVRAVESGHAGDEIFLALEYVPGQDLEATCARARRTGEAVPLGILASVLRQILRALEYAHAQARLPPRDVAPSNVLVGYDGIARLGDYGFALYEAKASRTAAGTPGFLAPEKRVQGAPVDARADLFAVGAVLHFALTGAPPEAGEDPTSKDALKARLEKRGVVLSPDVLTFLWRALQQDPNDRHGSAREMATALEMAMGEPIADERAVGEYVSRLFGVERAAEAVEMERWRNSDFDAAPRKPIASQEVTSPLPLGGGRRRGIVIAATAALGIIVVCVVVIGGRHENVQTMVVVSPPPPEPRVEQLKAPPNPPPPTEPQTPPPAPQDPNTTTTTTHETQSPTVKTAAKSVKPAAKTGEATAANEDRAALMKKLDEAKALARAGEITAARTLYAELADDPRARAKASTALAELEYKEGHYAEAIARADAAMRAGVGAPAFFVRALAELRGDKPADAARDFQKVLAAEPENEDAREGLKRAEAEMRRIP